MVSALQESVQRHLDAATADSTKEGALAGVLFFAADRNGNTLAHAASGVRQLGQAAKLEEDDYFWIASCTKLVTAIACMQLVEQGKVKLDDDASQYALYLREAKMLDGSAPKQMPTLRECLTHTCVNASFKKLGIEEFSCTKASLCTPWVSQPGEEWEYGTGIDVAGQVVEAVTGQKLDEYFKENIFKSLGIKHMTFLPQAGNILPKLAGMHQRDPTTGLLLPHAHWMEQEDAKIEVQYGGAGLYANAAEYCQILVALLNGGQHPQGGRILSPASAAELWEPQLRHELVKDLERTLYAVTTPQMTNPVIGCALPGVPKQWSIGGLLVPGGLAAFGRSPKSAWWAGIANHYWWIDHEDGTCGMIQCQLGPFGDPAAIGLWATLEVEVHQAVRSSA